MHFDVTADSVPVRDRFEAWRHAASDSLGIWSLAPRVTEGFWGTISATAKGMMLYARRESTGHEVARRTREIARKRLDGYWIYGEHGAGVTFRMKGQEFTTRPGDFFVADTDLEMAGQPVDHYSHQLWLLPRSLVDRHLPKSATRLLVRLPRRAGVGSLTASYLTSLSQNWDHIADDEADPVADTLARLIGLASGGAIAEQPDAIRTARLTRAKQFIERHLADADLAPTMVAGALGLSVRTLHTLFEPSGESFARHVQRRRLDECRAALLAQPSRQVTDIAFAWGFSHLSAFYRAFQAAFGMSPGEFRAASSRAGEF